MAGVDEELSDDYENVVKTKRLKAAVHYTTGKICEDCEADLEIKYTPQFIASVSETIFRCSERMAIDLEAFAKHGKRTTINSDDVLLLARKTKNLASYMRDLKDSLTATKEEQNVNRKAKKKAKESEKPTANATDESNM